MSSEMKGGGGESRLNLSFPTLTTSFHATHHWGLRRFTSTGHLSRSWEVFCLVTQRSSEHFHHKRYTCRLTTHNPDDSFADFQTALRVRLNVSDSEPLVIKQIDGDYMLDIETGLSLTGPRVSVFLLRCVHGQRRSMRLSAILLNLSLSYISRSMEV